jgi:hypothetical protein
MGFVRRVTAEHPTASAVAVVVAAIALAFLIGSLRSMCDCDYEIRQTASAIMEPLFAAPFFGVPLFAFWAGLGWLGTRAGSRGRWLLGGLFVLSLVVLFASADPFCGEEMPGERCYTPDPNDRPGP